MLFRSKQKTAYEITRSDWIQTCALPISGRGVEMLVERHDLSNLEALAYLEQRLREIGVISALTKAGFEAGNDVRVGEHEFELHI